jgi:hypothetical protein
MGNEGGLLRASIGARKGYGQSATGCATITGSICGLSAHPYAASIQRGFRRLDEGQT